MFTEAKLFQILDSAMKDISKRVAKCDVAAVPNVREFLASRLCSVYTRTKGDYEMTLVMSADQDVMKEFVRNMRRGAETNDDQIPTYMQEFANILYGHIISRVNQKAHLKAYFDIPSFKNGAYEHPPGDNLKIAERYYYDSPYGTVELKALYKDKKN